MRWKKFAGEIPHRGAWREGVVCPCGQHLSLWFSDTEDTVCPTCARVYALKIRVQVMTQGEGNGNVIKRYSPGNVYNMDTGEIEP